MELVEFVIKFKTCLIIHFYYFNGYFHLFTLIFGQSKFQFTFEKI